MIREASKKDLDIINSWLTSNNAIKEFLPFQKCYVYEIDNNVVGYIDYSLIYERGELNNIYVSSLYRHQQIASQLMTFMLNEAKKNKLQNITLEVAVNNEIAIKLYQKFNFVIVAKRTKYYNGIDAYLMKWEMM